MFGEDATYTKYYSYNPDLEREKDKSLWREVEENRNELKQRINEAVKMPVAYEGDLKLGDEWTLWTDGKWRRAEPWETCVMRLVNTMGGWKS